jgi:heme/copper-type cytochrome/quinol oxidase subunit 2
MNGALITVWMCAAAAAAVFAAMMISIATFGGRSGDCPRASARQRAAEMLWALIPIAIVLAAAMPAFKAMAFAGRSGVVQLAAAERAMPPHGLKP